MKNKIIVFLIFLFCASFAKADVFDVLFEPVKMNAAFINVYELNIKAGYIFSGIFSCKTGLENFDVSEFKADGSFVFNLEYFKYIDEYVAVGAGTSYQMAETLEDLDGKIGFVPAYFALKLRSWPQQQGIYGYAVGQIGYNFFYGGNIFADNFKTDGGGLYYAAGIGIVYSNYILECLYGFHSGSVSGRMTNNPEKIDVKLNQVTFSLGYKF